MTQDGVAGSPEARPASGQAAWRSARGLTGTARDILLRVGGLAIAIFIVIAIFTFLAKPNTFLTVNNALGMLRFMSTYAIVALGLTLVIVVGEIDLSFGFMFGLAMSLIAVAWIVWGWPVWLAILLAMAAAVGVGAFNALLVTLLRIPSFIVTLGSGQLIFGITLFVTNTSNFSPDYPPAGRVIAPSEIAFFDSFAHQEQLLGRFPAQGLWMLGVALVVGFLLSRSLFGFRLKAIGGNTVAAELARLPVSRYKFAAFIACALLASLAALLDFSFISSSQPNAGQQLLFPVFAAVIIGGASLSGGRGTAVGTLLGALLLAVISNGLALLAVGGFMSNLVFGGVTIAAVMLDRFTQRLRR
jgi:ribose/xylose/arabinose/galactoside ABC-type transport system permease subunit